MLGKIKLYASVIKSYIYCKTVLCILKMLGCGYSIRDGDADTYKIRYFDGIKFHTLLFKRVRRPSMVDTIILDNENNHLLPHIEECMGPFRDFHSQHVTPNMLGLKKIVVEYIDGQTKEFVDNEIIHT
jgi:hypothetical protein